jgi:hypothetical protein
VGAIKLKSNFFRNVIFILLIISGPLKPLINEYVTNLNITLIVFLLALLDLSIFFVIKHIKFKNLYLLNLLFLLSLFVLMLISISYTTSEQYYKEKILKFTLNFICFLYPITLKFFDWRLFYKVILFIVVPFTLFFIYELNYYWSDANAAYRSEDSGFYLISTAYLGLGNLLALGALVAIFKKKWISFFFILSILLAVGARGSFLFTILTIIIVNLSKLKMIKFNKKWLIYSLSVVPFIVGIIILKWDFF